MVTGHPLGLNQHQIGCLYEIICHAMKALNPEQRKEALQAYCRRCMEPLRKEGQKGPVGPCHCENDE